jgi:hypothetical protein
MKHKTKINKYWFALLACAILAVFYAGALNRADAQSAPTQFLMTWQADTYVPDGFSGKVMPASDSQIIVGIDLINMGKRVDLSAYKIFWYINEKFYQGADGLARISLAAPHFIGRNSITVRASITNYGAGVGKTINIPVVVPEAIIQSSAPSLAASAAPFNLQVYPYFFNIKDPSGLNYSWSLNNTVVGNQNPFVATREMANNGPSRIELTVSNPARPIERITQELTIFR